MPQLTEKQQEQKWQTEQDLRTLRDARELRGDKGRMKRAKTMAKQQLAELRAVSR